MKEYERFERRRTGSGSVLTMRPLGTLEAEVEAEPIWCGTPVQDLKSLPTRDVARPRRRSPLWRPRGGEALSFCQPRRRGS